MDRKQLIELIRKHVKEENLVKHMIAVEFIMRALAEHFGEDAEKWGTAGLVHDIDLDKTRKMPKKHGIVGAEMLKELGFADDIVYAVKVHNPVHNLPRKSLLDKALYSADPMSGLIVACALVKGKKLANVDSKFVLKRFKEKRFASGANREQIASCSEMGLTLEEFVDISLNALKNHAKELGL